MANESINTKPEVPEYLIGDWDENGNARYTLVGIKTLNKPDNDLIMEAFTIRASYDEVNP